MTPIYATASENRAARHMAELIALRMEIVGKPREAQAVRKFAAEMTGIVKIEAEQPTEAPHAQR